MLLYLLPNPNLRIMITYCFTSRNKTVVKWYKNQSLEGLQQEYILTSRLSTTNGKCYEKRAEGEKGGGMRHTSFTVMWNFVMRLKHSP
jgi:hypothetical protein